MNASCTKFYGPRPFILPEQRRVPLLPGNNFHDDPVLKGTRQHKAQHFNIVNGVPTTTLLKPGPPPVYEKLDVKADEIKSDGTNKSINNATGHLPPWLSEDAALTFGAYFKEVVLDSAIEKLRVRRCAITFHPEDSTVVVKEKLLPNSGFVNTTLVKRHRIPSQTNPTGFLTLEVFNIDRTVEIYSKVFHIVSCDDATRRHLIAKGVDVPPNMNFPQDDDAFMNYTTKRLATEMKPKKELNPTDMELKRHHEYGNAGRVTKPTPVQVVQSQQFFNNDGKVLTFYGVWDDRSNPHGDVHFLRVNYNLADDTLEMVETGNTGGHEPAGKILMAQKIPKATEGSDEKLSLLDTLKTTAIQHSTFGVKLATGYVTAKDLFIGGLINVHGRQIFLYDCSSWTRKHYKNTEGVDLAPAVDIEKKFDLAPKPFPKSVPPLHDGIGSEEDSLGNWKRMILKPPKRDYRKWSENMGKTMRWVLRMIPGANDTPNTALRHVLLTFYLEDGTMQIDEISIANTGILGGKYLNRQAVKKCLPDGRWEPYAESDFEVGKIVEIFSRKFEVIVEDDNTTKMRLGYEDPVSVEYIQQTIQRMQEAVHTKFVRRREAFRATTTKSNNSVDLDEFIAFFASINIELSRQIAKVIFHHYDSNNDGMLDYNEYVQILSGGPPSLQELEKSALTLQGMSIAQSKAVVGGVLSASASVSRLKSSALGKSDALDSIEKSQIDANSKALQKKVMRQLRDKLEQRRIDTVETFRLLGGAREDGRARKPDFLNAVRDKLHMQLSLEEIQVISDIFFPGDNPLTLRDFVELINAKDESLTRVGDPTPVNPSLRRAVNMPGRNKLSGVPLIDSLRRKIFAMGGSNGFRTITKILCRMDDDGNKQLSRRELQSGLSEYGLRLTVEEMDEIMRWLDKDRSGQVSAQELCSALRGEMNERRLTLVLEAYNLLDLNLDGEVSLGEISKLYDASKHPDVMKGTKRPEQVYSDFIAGWDRDGNRLITRQEWIEYYGDLSAGIESDEYFELMVRNTWHISGGTGVCACTSTRRVLVTHKNGQQTLEEVKNDLGIGPKDLERMRTKLEQQGILDILTISLTQ